MLLRVWGVEKAGGEGGEEDGRGWTFGTKSRLRGKPSRTVTALSPALKVTETFLNSTLGKLDKWARVRNERGARVGRRMGEEG